MCKRCSGGVQTGVYICRFCSLKQLQEKIHLQKRFPSADSDSAFCTPIRTKAECFSDQFFRSLKRSRKRLLRICLPGVRVVAETAAHGAALEKNEIADAGAIHRSKAFCGMDQSLYAASACRVTFFHGRFSK